MLALVVHHLGSPYAPQSALAPLRLCPHSTTLYYNSTKIPQLPAPPSYAPPYVPQSALAPLRLCPPTHLYYSTKIPQLPAPSYKPQSALAPLRLCLHLYYTIQRKSLSFPRRRTRRRTRLSPRLRPPGSVLPYYMCTTIQRQSLSFPRRRTYAPQYAPQSVIHSTKIPPGCVFISFSSPLRFHPRFVFIPAGATPFRFRSVSL